MKKVDENELKQISERPLGERLVYSLKQAVAWSRGQINLKVTVLPAPPKRLSGRQIRMLRKKLNLSQSVMAGLLGVSFKAVQSWEQGSRKPSMSALRLMELLEKNPSSLLEATGMNKASRAAA
jgi:putative transcriptional regulator